MSLFNSNRRGHVNSAMALSLGVTFCGCVIGSHRLAFIGLNIGLWELWGTCDNDIDTRSPRKGPWPRRLWVLWWKPYALAVAHRSRWSHSLLFGLPMRLTVGLWPVFLGLGAASILRDGFAVAFMPLVTDLIIACAVADTLHMIKDGYGPGEIIFGKG